MKTQARGGGGWPAGLVAAVLGLGLGMVAVVPLLVGSAGAAPSGDTVVSAHVAFENCPSATTVLKAAVPNTPFAGPAAVHVLVTLTNDGSIACGPSPTSVPAGHGSLDVGPCGPIPMVVDNRAGQDVWPGKNALFCPMETELPVAAGSTLAAVANWTLNGGTTPTGRYTIVIDKVLKLVVTIGSSAAGKGTTTTTTSTTGTGKTGKTSKVRGTTLHRASTESAHVAVSGCPSATTVLSATLPQRSFTQQQAVTATVKLTNTSGSGCGPTASPLPAGNQFTIGPCGTLGLGVVGPKGQDVYPGHLELACPAEFGLHLAAGSSVSTTAVWDQEASYNSKKLAPRGIYTLVIGGVLHLKITLTGLSKGTLPTVSPAPSGSAAPSAPPTLVPGQALPPGIKICTILPNAGSSSSVGSGSGSGSGSGGGAGSGSGSSGSGQTCSVGPVVPPKLSPTPAPGCKGSATATLISAGAGPPPKVDCGPLGAEATTPAKGQ